MKKFVVLTSQRSGSTWLVDLLNNHPDISAASELFLGRSTQEDPHGYSFNQFYYYKKRTLAIRPFSTFLYLQKFENDAKNGAAGFKLMHSQLRFLLELIPWFVIRRYRIIRLTRRNHLNKIISAKLRRETNIAHLKDRSGITQEAEVYLDPQETLNKIQYKERQKKRMDFLAEYLPNPSLYITYNQLRNDCTSAMNKVADFLQVEKQEKWKSKHKKINKKSQEGRLENYLEVKSVLSQTSFKKLLNQ